MDERFKVCKNVLFIWLKEYNNYKADFIIEKYSNRICAKCNRKAFCIVARWFGGKEVRCGDHMDKE